MSVQDRLDRIRDVVDPGLSLRIMETQGADIPPPSPAAPAKRIARPLQAEDPALDKPKRLTVGTSGVTKPIMKGRR